MITPQQVRLIRETFPGILEIAGPVSKLFYGRLFQLAPSSRKLFRGDIEAQGRKFIDMLTSLVDHADNLDAQSPALRSLGQRHVAYGVLPAHYETLKIAFGWALLQALEAGFSPPVKDAWMALIDDVSASMKAGAAELSDGLDNLTGP